MVMTIMASGCTKLDKDNDISDTSQTTTSQTTTAVTTVEDSSSLPPLVEDGKHVTKIRLYYWDDKDNIVSNPVHKSVWEKGKDIESFSPFYSDEPTLPPKNIIYRWQSYFDNLVDCNDYKTGFFLSFTLKNGEMHSIRIIKPEDTEVYKEYIETYIYDDYHQKVGAFHSHLLPSQMKPETLLTTIKLTVGKKGDEVQSIKLTAFAYKDENDFDPKTNEYTGQISTTVDVERQ